MVVLKNKKKVYKSLDIVDAHSELLTSLTHSKIRRVRQIRQIRQIF